MSIGIGSDLGGAFAGCVAFAALAYTVLPDEMLDVLSMLGLLFVAVGILAMAYVVIADAIDEKNKGE